MTKNTPAICAVGGDTLVTITGVSGGWTTYQKTPNGPELKARNSWFRAPTDEELMAAVPKLKPATVAAPKPKPAVAAPKPDVAPLPLPLPATVAADLSHYVLHTIKSASGRKTLDINDRAAGLLRGNDISDCHFIVAKHMAAVKGEIRSVDQIEQELLSQYSHLNPGMQRMNLGNRLRKVMGTYGNMNAHKTKRGVTRPAASEPTHPTVIRVRQGETVVIETASAQH